MTPEQIAEIEQRADAAKRIALYVPEMRDSYLSGERPIFNEETVAILTDHPDARIGDSEDLTFFLHSLDDMRALLAEVTQLRAKLEASERGGAELGRTITFLTELMTGTALIGGDDAIGMVRALVPALVEADALTADQATRVHAGLDAQQAAREGLTKQLAHAEADRDSYREALAADDKGALILAQWEALAAADDDKDRLAGEVGRLRVELAAVPTKVAEGIGAELALTNREMTALAQLDHDTHHEECSEVWRGYFGRVAIAHLDGTDQQDER